MIKSIKKISKKHYIQCGLAVLLTGLVLYITSALWFNKEVIVSFNTEAKKEIYYQVFYTEANGQNFNEKQSVRKNIKSGSQKVEILLPIEKTMKFRLDIGSNPDEVVISDLQVRGSKNVKLNYNEFNKNQIDKYEVKDGKLYITSNKGDPYIWYKPELNLPAGMQIDWCRLIIISVLAFLLMYKFVQYLSKFKIEKQYSRIDIVMLSVFFALLLVPASHISDAEKSEQENRMLAKKPQLTIDGGGYNNYGVQFDAWFNDRFWGRYFLTQLYKVGQYLIGLNSFEKVYIGKDKYLFSRFYNLDERIRNSDLFSNEEIKDINVQLSFLNTFAKERNIVVYIEINPDKDSLYAEYLPDFFYKDNTISRREQFMKYVENFSNIRVISQYEQLKKAKLKEPVFPKSGTHPTQWGIYNMYLNLINTMRIDFNNIPPTIPLNKLQRKDKILSDVDTLNNLGIPYFIYGDKNMYEIDCKLPKLNYEYLNTRKKQESKMKNYYDDIYIHEKKNKVSMPRIFVLGDSFALRYNKYLPYHFSSVIQVFSGHGRDYEFSKYIEMIDNLKPDIILISTTERFLQRFLHLEFPIEIKEN